MKRAVKILAVVLVLLTLCSCNFTKQEPISDTGEVSKEMVKEVKNVFSLIPKGTFFTFESRNNGLMLVSPDLKTEINLTEKIAKLNANYEYTLSNDCSKLLLQYIVKWKGTFESVINHYQMIFDLSGAVLFSNEYSTEYQEYIPGHDTYFFPSDYFLYTDDFHYITYSSGSANRSYLIDTVKKRKTETYATKFGERIDSNYIYYGNEVYNIKTRKLITIGDCSHVYEIKNDIAFIAYTKQIPIEGKINYDTKYYHLDLKTNKRTEMDKSKINTKHIPVISPNSAYSAEIYDKYDFENHAGDIGIHITDLKTKKKRVYQCESNEYFSNLRWVEKK